MSDLTTSTASVLSAVDLSKLPFPPDLIARAYEDVLADMLADVRAYYRQKTGQDLIVHEADPAYVAIEACAYRRHKDLLDYQSQVKNMLVAYAAGAWLDHLGANPDFKCTRLVIVPADDSTNPPTPAVMEPDDAYRARMVLGNEGYTTAGSDGANLFFTLSADGDVRDASVQSPAPCDVLLTVLTWSNNGAASTALLRKIETVFANERLRSPCDAYTAQAAKITTYSAVLNITSYPGVDVPDLIVRSRAAVEAHCAAHFRLGHDITLSGLIAAATVLGVQKVSVVSPTVDLICDLSSACRCSSVVINHVGVAL